MIRSLEQLTACLLIAGLLAACGGNIRDVTDEPPQASIDRIERLSGGVLIELALGNVNDEPLRLRSVDLRVEIGGVELTKGRQETPLMISANGREVLNVRLPATPAGLDRLERLARGDVARLPWTLTLDLGIVESPDRETRTEGWLHPVPGQPDRFR